MRVVGLGWGIGGAGREERASDLFHRLEVVALVRPPHLDHDRRAGFRDPARLAQRRDEIVGEEERVEAGDQIEHVIVVRQRLHLSDLELGGGQPQASELDQRL